MTTLEDRGEGASSMEPLRISERSRHRPQLTDLALDLVAQSSSFRSSLPLGVNHALADLVRSMNCYYSNLIEGHDTHPIDIERALQDDYSQNPEQRNLQLEAKAHIDVQQWIDQGELQGKVITVDSLCEIHQRFYEELPDELLWVTWPETEERIRITPGEYRQKNVRVGQHIAISPGAIPRFMARFENSYDSLGKAETIIAAATVHHRLLWIHPFLDGNGRVARLLSHAMLSEALETDGLWSVARGLARNQQTYKSHLARCDLPRRNDLDGRGQLSEEALADFTHFFLETCLDQIQFMKSLVQPEQLNSRILSWAAGEINANRLAPKTERILKELLYQGVLPRQDIPALLDTGERQARRIVATLVDQGVICTETTKTPLKIAFPAKLASQWMPGLFPDKV